MKTSTIIAMVFTMIASSSAMPSPLRNDFNSSLTYKKSGVTLQARQDTVPSCSVPCIQNAIAKVTPCHFTDYACACKYHGKVTGAATACVVGSCGLQRAVKVVVPAVRKMCQKEAQKDAEEKEEEAERDLDEDEEDEDEEEGDDDEDDEEKKEEQAKRQLIVPDEEDLVFEIDPINVDEYDEEEEEEEE